MKFRAVFCFSAAILAAILAAGDVLAFGGMLSPKDFNKMYYLASQGKVGILREAVNRGLNIDATNPNGDTGLCIAIKRKNYIAYNSFRMSGANPRHICTYEINKEYREFLESNKTVHTEKVIGNEESLYYRGEESSWWPWILGGAAVGGAALALSGGGGGGGSAVAEDDTVVPVNPGYGLATLVTNTKNTINSGGFENSVARSISNTLSDSAIGSIKLLPDVLDNSEQLLSYVKVSDSAYFDNLRGGSIHLSDATIGAMATGEGSKALNNGNIEIDARNGSIGMAASNGAQVINGPEGTGDKGYGNIDISFKGNNEGNAVIGMYGDTSSKIVNMGRITGTTSIMATEETENDAATGEKSDNEAENGTAADDEEAETVTQANSGTILGMALFDLYTGTNLSANTVTAENYGEIALSAGYNSATDVAVSLIGMGSYIDGDFLDGKNNPAFAEQMKLSNYGDITLNYQGAYRLADTALKLGQGGLIGMRADAATTALNQGNIKIDLTSTTMAAETDVAAGMLSVHGGELANGNENNVYDGTGAETGGTVRIVNEANSGGVSYGMLAAKGNGTQTRIYDWKAPKLANYGLIDMQASNAYGMASFAGGDVVNYGVINLGVENGQSRYNNNYGLYAAGDDKTKEVLLQNKGIINVYSEKSTAIYNAFAGSVEMINDGYIYLSNKATNSVVFGGDFSSAHNNGSILYKVGNSESFVRPSSPFDDSNVVAGVVQVSNNTDATKQLFANEGEMTVGAAFDKNVDYGGTYGTAGVWISKQGAAVNNGTIALKSFDKDYAQYNVGMWLDSASTAEAYANNYGDIVVEATNSAGIRNDSAGGAAATNFGSIYVNGANSYGMQTTAEQATIFNGRSQSPADSVNAIYVKGNNSIGMHVKNGTAYNYGSIYLQGNGATGIRLNGGTAKLAEEGTIRHEAGYKDITYFWLTNAASYTFDYSGGLEIEGFTLGKATDGGVAYFSKSSTAYAKGEDAYLFVADGNGSAVYNNGTIEASAGASPIIASNGALAQNSGTISVTGGAGRAMSASGENATVENTFGGTIAVNGGTGMYASQLGSAYNYARIDVTDGVGMYLTDKTLSGTTIGGNSGTISVSGQGNIGVKAVSGAAFENSGSIFVSCPGCTGSYAYGIYVPNSSETVINGSDGYITVGDNSIGMSGGVNQGNIVLASDTAIGMIGGTNDGKISGIGRLAQNTDNAGEISVTSGTGMYIETGAAANNTGTVTVGTGDGAHVKGSFTNSGEITVGTGNGILVDGGSANNSGTITLAGNGYGVKVESGSFVNTGTITYNSKNGGACSNGAAGGTCTDAGAENATASMAKELVYVGENGTFVNGGAVDFAEDKVDFDAMKTDDSGAFAVAGGGTYKAESFKGNVVADSSIVMGGFKDMYVNENSFEGKNEGLNISSGSYMFDATLNDKGDVTDVELNRKKFEELVDDNEIAEFFETNYGLENNEKMYNALKAAANQGDFDHTAEVETGQNFYANLARENMAVLRGINSQEQGRILEEGLDGRFLGADYYRTGKNAQSGLSGYADNVYSPYFSYGTKLNKNWSMGGTLRAAYADAEYDEASSSRNNKILLAFMPILYQNGDFKFLATPSAGAGYGTYKRHALSGTYEADTLDFYYGIYSHAEYSIDLKVAELVTEAELNLQGAYMSKAEEDGGLNLDSNSSVSLEAGIGAKLRKRIQLAKERSLMLALGAKYYHEFANPYKDLRVGMDGSPVDFGLKGYDEGKNRLKTTAEAVYRDGNLAVQAEISHNAEKENSIEGGVGVRYHFN